MSYTIVKDFIPGIPQIAYRKGVGAYEGVVAHATESANHSGLDTPASEVTWEKRTFNDAFVHFFVGVEDGKAVIRQCASTEYISWHCGKFANPRFVGVEVCMYDDPATFKLAYDAYVWVLAKILADKRLPIVRANPDGTGTFWLHDEVSRYLGGTTHTDPNVYFQAHGVTQDVFYADVKRQYAVLAGFFCVEIGTNIYLHKSKDAAYFRAWSVFLETGTNVVVYDPQGNVYTVAKHPKDRPPVTLNQ